MKTITTILLLFLSQILLCQQSLQEELIELAEIYKKYHVSSPNDDVFTRLNSITSKELEASRNFIDELIREHNNIASKPYLTKPDSATLKFVYTIRELNFNLFQSEPIDNHFLIDSLLNSTINKYELLSSYYDMLFSTITNKNRPLKMASYNFNLSEYNLQEATDQGIFFLKSMETFSLLIWGLMNVPDPPNYKKALEIIKNYPTYNGRPYYEFTNLDFDDFTVKVDKSKPKESFKTYHLNKYMNTVVYHSLCLMQNKRMEKEGLEVISKSIVRDERYRDYSSSKKFFEKSFKDF